MSYYSLVQIRLYKGRITIATGYYTKLTLFILDCCISSKLLSMEVQYELPLIGKQLQSLMANIEWKFIYILVDLTRNSCEKCNFLGPWQESNPAIPVQRSNQLSYRGQLSSSDHKFLDSTKTCGIWQSQTGSTLLVKL